MTIEYRTPSPGDLAAVMGLMPALYSEIGPGLETVLAEFIEDKYYFKLLAVEKQTGAAASAGRTIDIVTDCFCAP